MGEPTLHYATDRRCYNGAPCSDLKKEWDSIEDIQKSIKAKFPQFTCTYFPAEGKYCSFVRYVGVTGVMYEDRGECLLEAWRILIGEE